MRFTIRDLFLLTLIVALAAGWWVDRSSLARRDAEWEKQFGQAMRILSKESGNEHFFDTPGGPYTVNRKPDPESETSNPPSPPAQTEPGKGPDGAQPQRR